MLLLGLPSLWSYQCHKAQDSDLCLPVVSFPVCYQCLPAWSMLLFRFYAKWLANFWFPPFTMPHHCTQNSCERCCSHECYWYYAIVSGLCLMTNSCYLAQCRCQRLLTWLCVLTIGILVCLQSPVFMPLIQCYAGQLYDTLWFPTFPLTLRFNVHTIIVTLYVSWQYMIIPGPLVNAPLSILCQVTNHGFPPTPHFPPHHCYRFIVRTNIVVCCGSTL